MKRILGLCLLAALFATGLHYYQKYYPFRFHEQQISLWTEPNSEAFLVYRNKMIRWNIPDTQRVGAETRKLFGQVRSGQIDPARLERKADKLIQRLFDLNDDLSGRSAPDDFLVPARSLARAQGDFYRCLVQLKKIPPDAGREAAFEDAWQNWLAGERNTRAARAGIRTDIVFRAED